MSDEIKAILRAEYEGELDVEQAIRRLHETNERLRADPEENQRIREIVDAVDAEIEAERARNLMVHSMAPRRVAEGRQPHRAYPPERMRKNTSRLPDDLRAELYSGRHSVIAAYYLAEQAVEATAEATNQMETALLKVRRLSVGKGGWLVGVPLFYQLIEMVLGLVLVAAALTSAIVSRHLGFSSAASTIALAAAFIAVTAERGLRRHALTLECRRTARHVKSVAAAARQAVRDLDLQWTDLEVSVGESQDELKSLRNEGLNATVELTKAVLERYSSVDLREEIAELAERRRDIVRASGSSSLQRKSKRLALRDETVEELNTEVDEIKSVDRAP